jgi:hypothetical protein
MGRATTYTLLPIDTWAQIMGIDPWGFNQIGEGFPNPGTGQCDDVFYQYQWQRDFISREEIATAIAEAEYALAEQLGYWPAPRYIVDEHADYPRTAPLARQRYLNMVGLRWRRVIGGGTFNRTSISAGVAVTLSDPDGDLVDELFTVTFPTSVTDPNEIALYFAAADCLGEPVSEAWRIRPVNVSINAGQATVTGHASLLVKPNLTTITDPVVLDVTNSIYVTAVDAYRAFRDSTHTDATPYQGVAVWDNDPSCEPDCTFEIGPVCITERNAEQGLVSVNVDQWPCRWIPNRLQLNYLAGYPLDSQGRMNDELARCVARLATALLPTEKCGCTRWNKILDYWRAKPNEGDDGRSFSQREIDTNPFVERNGALWAWKRVNSLRSFGSVSA